MIDFRAPTVGDIPRLARVLSSYRGEICDLTPSNIVMWRRYYGTELAFEELADGTELLYLRYATDPDETPSDDLPQEVSYTCPHAYHAGDEAIAERGVILHPGEVSAAIGRLISGGARAFCCLSEAECGLISPFLPEARVWHDRDWNDYIYNAADMISLGGRHLSGQRNHINKFKATAGQWHVEDISESNIRAAGEFCEEYYHRLEAAGELGEALIGERDAVREVLANWQGYGQEGILLYAGERVAAMTFGEIVGGMLCVHVEKATRELPGAYPMVFHEFCLRLAGRISTVNREEDCGEEGLRRSKLSLHPIRMPPKFFLSIDR